MRDLLALDFLGSPRQRHGRGEGDLFIEVGEVFRRGLKPLDVYPDFHIRSKEKGQISFKGVRPSRGRYSPDTLSSVSRIYIFKGGIRKRPKWSKEKKIIAFIAKLEVQFTHSLLKQHLIVFPQSRSGRTWEVLLFSQKLQSSVFCAPVLLKRGDDNRGFV